MLEVGGRAVTYDYFPVSLAAQQGPRTTSLAPETIYGYLIRFL
jgi:hypothetical protein